MLTRGIKKITKRSHSTLRSFNIKKTKVFASHEQFIRIWSSQFNMPPSKCSIQASSPAPSNDTQLSFRKQAQLFWKKGMASLAGSQQKRIYLKTLVSWSNDCSNKATSQKSKTARLNCECLDESQYVISQRISTRRERRLGLCVYQFNSPFANQQKSTRPIHHWVHL